MTKRSTSAIIFFTVILTFLLNIFFGRFLAARLSLLPLFDRWKILSPETPIVITQRQEIRTSDSGDILSAIDGVKSKLSLLVSMGASDIKILGGAVNVTSDGWFVTTKTAVGTTKPSAMKVKLENGTFSEVARVVPDPATGLVFLQVNAKGVAAASFGKSASLQPGEKVAFVLSSMYDRQVSAAAKTVAKSQNDTFEVVFRANFFSRNFTVSDSSGTVPGEAVVGMNGDVLGIMDNGAVIPSDVIKNAVNVFLSSGQYLPRADFGFSYKMVTSAEHAALSVPEGAMLVKPSAQDSAVAAGSPAQKAGLTEGDVIIAVNGSVVDENNQLETVLEQFKPGSALSVSFSRGGKVLGTVLTPGTLQ